MKKVFVLDTNVLILDPFSIYKFEDNDVVIPIYVLEELDKHKTRNDEVGKNARQVTRELDDLRDLGHLNDGVELESGSTVRIHTPKVLEDHDFMDMSNMDNKIMSCALQIKDEYENTVLITNDINLRVRADSVGLVTEKYENNRSEISFEEEGCLEVCLNSAQIDEFYEKKGLVISDYPGLVPNEMVLVTSNDSFHHSGIARITSDCERLVPIRNYAGGVWGIQPKNKEQKHALDLLMDDDVKLVTLAGQAGTGKTLISIAAALHKVTEENIYRKLLVSRPVIPMGKDIGYLPGSLQEKMNPWMKPIFDNVDFLLDMKNSNKGTFKTKGSEELMGFGIIEIEPITYIRGRSIPNQFMIVDEAQNLTAHEVKTILTRAGEGTKIVLTGDPFQIDNPYLDSENNGLSYVIQKMRGQSIYGHVTLHKGERSMLAELAAKLL